MDYATAKRIQQRGRALAQMLVGSMTPGERLGVAISMLNAVLDERPKIRGEMLHDVIEVLKADHVGEAVEL